MLEVNTNLSVCSFAADSWVDVDFYSNNNICFVIDEIPQDKDAIWIISKLSEDGLFAEVPVLFTSYNAMYEFDKSGFASFAYDILPDPFDYEIAYRRLMNIAEIRQLKSQIYKLTQIHTKRILNRANKLKEQNTKMQTMNYDLVELLVAAIESRDLGSGQHIKRIRLFTKALTESVMELFPEYGITKEQAEYIYYASPNSLVYNNETYIEDMGEEAIEILYPEGFDFAQKYDANCYKDLDKTTKEYLNKLWNRLTITS
jgi:putative two-component system response regulator